MIGSGRYLRVSQNSGRVLSSRSSATERRHPAIVLPLHSSFAVGLALMVFPGLCQIDVDWRLSLAASG